MKTGLVLEGGAMRVMYTSGVLDVFLDENITFDAITAVSAGALFGTNYLSCQRGRSIRMSKRFNPDKRYISLSSLLKTGNLVNTEFAYHKVPHELDLFDNDKYKKSNTTFYAAVTNINSGKAEYIQIKDIFSQMDVLRASASLPFVSKPVKIDNQLYLDGGVCDSIPYKNFIRNGYDKIIVILTRDINYRKKPAASGLVDLFYHKYPAFAKALKNRHKMYNESVEELISLEKEGKIFVIRPSLPIEIGRIEKNAEKLQQVYELGVSDAKNILNALYSFIG